MRAVGFLCTGAGGHGGVVQSFLPLVQIRPLQLMMHLRHVLSTGAGGTFLILWRHGGAAVATLQERTSKLHHHGSTAEWPWLGCVRG